MKIKCAYGIAAGISQIKQETECQDKIKTIEQNGAFVAALADELVVEAAATLVAERFDELFASEDDFIKKTILENVSGMSGTLLVAVKGNHYLALHIGSGLIARFNGNLSLLSRPENETETDSASGNLAKTNLRIYKGDLQEPFGFMLMSDGACRSLFENSTGNLSPACGTFFEWLKEYDEEAVSEALVDNINKYFLKDTKGDIGIALMVSREDDLEISEPHEMETEEAFAQNEVTSEEDDSAKSSNKIGKIVKYTIIALILATVVLLACLLKPASVPEQKQEAKADNVPPVTSSEDNAPPVTFSVDNVPTVTFSVENPKIFDAGEYEIGSDIPAGEYFFCTGKMMQPDSIEIDGESCLSEQLFCMTIQLEEGETLTSDYGFTKAENVNPVKATDGILISGKYKIGKDVAPGEYTVLPAYKNKGGRYYSVLDGEISNDAEISGEMTVQVPEEGYIVIYNSIIVVDQI